MKKYNKLSIQVALMGITLIVFSFIPELPIWQDWFTFEMKSGWKCRHFREDVEYSHSHWNYRGWIWFVTGLALFIIQLVRVIIIFDNEKEEL